MAQPTAPPAFAPTASDAERLRAKVAERRRVKARRDLRWRECHTTLPRHLALDAERSTLPVRLFSGRDPFSAPSPLRDAPNG